MSVKDTINELDETIFSKELKEKMVESIDNTVNEKIVENTLKLEKKYEEKELQLESDFKKQVQNFKDSERVKIDEFLEKQTESIQKELAPKYADSAIVEDSLKMYKHMQTFIKESAKLLNVDTSFYAKEREYIAEIDMLKEQVKRANDVAIRLIKFGLKEDVKESLNPSILPQFDKLSEMIEYKDENDYQHKLEKIVESLNMQFDDIKKEIKESVEKHESKKVLSESFEDFKKNLKKIPEKKTEIIVETTKVVNGDDDKSAYLY